MRFLRVALTLAVLAMVGMFGSAAVGAADLDDYLWRSRPLLLFAPTPKDPRLSETLSRIQASRCEFTDRDMVTGVVVVDGDSTLDGQSVGSDEARRLRKQFAIGSDAFAAILIGKDGGEKWRADDVPDLQRIYAVIDGMPMRGREAGSGRC